MATKEKWIDLFEKAVGRPPHALEIEEGQKADFDLKAIKGIAAMGLDQETTPSEPTEEVDEYDVAEEVFEDLPLGDEEETTPLETEELSPVSQADQGQTEENSEAASKEAQAIWMKAFKPMLDVSLFLRNSYLVSLQVMMYQPSISLSQMVRLRNQPSQLWLKGRKS